MAVVAGIGAAGFYGWHLSRGRAGTLSPPLAVEASEGHAERTPLHRRASLPWIDAGAAMGRTFPIEGGRDELVPVSGTIISGLGEVGLSLTDLADLEFDLDGLPPGPGRPMTPTLRLVDMIHPEQPLSLSMHELSQLCGMLTARINDTGIEGVYVAAVRGTASPSGQFVLLVYSATVATIEVQDHRTVRNQPLDTARIVGECPLQVGSKIHRESMMSYVDTLEQRLQSAVDVTLAQAPIRWGVALKIEIGLEDSRENE